MKLQDRERSPSRRCLPFDSSRRGDNYDVGKLGWRLRISNLKGEGMRPNISAVLISALIFSTAALAHTGVKNPAVKARMESMKRIGADMKVIGEMVKGKAPVNVDAARIAAASIARSAAETPALFEANEDDPKSEALPAIWSDFDDFTTKSVDLETVAQSLSTSITEAGDLAPALEMLGETCRACHKLYRE